MPRHGQHTHNKHPRGREDSPRGRGGREDSPRGARGQDLPAQQRQPSARIAIKTTTSSKQVATEATSASTSSSSTTSLKTSEDVYQRFCHDPCLMELTSQVRVGYEDRVEKTMLELSLEKFRPINKGGDLPYHRIWYFRVLYPDFDGDVAAAARIYEGREDEGGVGEEGEQDGPLGEEQQNDDDVEQQVHVDVVEQDPVDEDNVHAEQNVLPQDEDEREVEDGLERAPPPWTQNELKKARGLIWDRAARFDLVFKSGDNYNAPNLLPTWAKIQHAIANTKRVEQEKAYLLQQKQAKRQLAQQKSVFARSNHGADKDHRREVGEASTECKSSLDDAMVLLKGIPVTKLHLAPSATISSSTNNGNYDHELLKQEQLRVVSFNVLMDAFLTEEQKRQSPGRWRACVKFLLSLDADVWILQEATAEFVAILKETLSRPGEYEFDIDAGYSPTFHMCCASDLIVGGQGGSGDTTSGTTMLSDGTNERELRDRKTKAYGQVIVSRSEILAACEVELGPAKKAVFAEVKVSSPQTSILVGAVHLTANHEEKIMGGQQDRRHTINTLKRLAQMEKTGQFLDMVLKNSDGHAATTPLPLAVIAGDFNEDSDLLDLSEEELTSLAKERALEITSSRLSSQEEDQHVVLDVLDQHFLLQCNNIRRDLEAYRTSAERVFGFLGDRQMSGKGNTNRNSNRLLQLMRTNRKATDDRRDCASTGPSFNPVENPLAEQNSQSNPYPRQLDNFMLSRDYLRRGQEGERQQQAQNDLSLSCGKIYTALARGGEEGKMILSDHEAVVCEIPSIPSEKSQLQRPHGRGPELSSVVARLGSEAYRRKVLHWQARQAETHRNVGFSWFLPDGVIPVGSSVGDCSSNKVATTNTTANKLADCLYTATCCGSSNTSRVFEDLSAADHGDEDNLTSRFFQTISDVRTEVHSTSEEHSHLASRPVIEVIPPVIDLSHDRIPPSLVERILKYALFNVSPLASTEFELDIIIVDHTTNSKTNYTKRKTNSYIIALKAVNETLTALKEIRDALDALLPPSPSGPLRDARERKSGFEPRLVLAHAESLVEAQTRFSEVKEKLLQKLQLKKWSDRSDRSADALIFRGPPLTRISGVQSKHRQDHRDFLGNGSMVEVSCFCEDIPLMGDLDAVAKSAGPLAKMTSELLEKQMEKIGDEKNSHQQRTAIVGFRPIGSVALGLPAATAHDLDYCCFSVSKGYHHGKCILPNLASCPAKDEVELQETQNREQHASMLNEVAARLRTSTRPAAVEFQPPGRAGKGVAQNNPSPSKPNSSSKDMRNRSNVVVTASLSEEHEVDVAAEARVPVCRLHVRFTKAEGQHLAAEHQVQENAKLAQKMTKLVEIQAGLKAFEAHIRLRERILSICAAFGFDYVHDFLGALSRVRHLARQERLCGPGYPNGLQWTLLVADAILVAGWTNSKISKNQKMKAKELSLGVTGDEDEKNLPSRSPSMKATNGINAEKIIDILFYTLLGTTEKREAVFGHADDWVVVVEQQSLTSSTTTRSSDFAGSNSTSSLMKNPTAACTRPVILQVLERMQTSWSSASSGLNANAGAGAGRSPRAVFSKASNTLDSLLTFILQKEPEFEWVVVAKNEKTTRDVGDTTETPTSSMKPNMSQNAQVQEKSVLQVAGDLFRYAVVVRPYPEVSDGVYVFGLVFNESKRDSILHVCEQWGAKLIRTQQLGELVA
ncbi:unnamed protein product [Amoebophrya sp. A25]|nr:unnamed protein product [Amoebophrya sp. A25]|eukprot:GSA25T00019222001.1